MVVPTYLFQLTHELTPPKGKYIFVITTYSNIKRYDQTISRFLSSHVLISAVVKSAESKRLHAVAGIHTKGSKRSARTADLNKQG